jgi:hypothetical protein
MRTRRAGGTSTWTSQRHFECATAPQLQSNQRGSKPFRAVGDAVIETVAPGGGEQGSLWNSCLVSKNPSLPARPAKLDYTHTFPSVKVYYEFA